MTLNEQLQGWAEWRRSQPNCPQSPATWVRRDPTKDPKPNTKPVRQIAEAMAAVCQHQDRRAESVVVVQVDALYRERLGDGVCSGPLGLARASYWSRRAMGLAILQTWIEAAGRQRSRANA